MLVYPVSPVMAATNALQRYIFMKMTYYDNTPDDYEPPYFIPITAD